MMADPILHSVAEPPKAQEISTKNISITPRIAELLQSIYTVSGTAATSIALGKAVDSARDLQNFVDPDDVLDFSLEAGYEAVNEVCSHVEELAKLLNIDIKKPSTYKLKPIFIEK
jgi:hypothetical protein